MPEFYSLVCAQCEAQRSACSGCFYAGGLNNNFTAKVTPRKDSSTKAQKARRKAKAFCAKGGRTVR